MTTEKHTGQGATRRQFIGRTAALLAAGGAVQAWPQFAAGKVLGANDRIGVGVIGAGGRAQAHLQMVHYLKEQRKLPVQISAVCDVYRPRMQRAAEAYGAKGYMDHRELLNDPNVDVVCIATPDHLHGYQAIDALQAGKDVYCEKPVTHWRQFELIKRLAGEAKKTGRVFQLGTQGMSDAAWDQARKLIADGLIGQPIHAECGYFRVGDWGERGMPVDDPNAKPGSDLNWEAFLGDSPKRPFDVSRFFRWRMYEDYAGGPVTDLFPHSLTPIVSMLGLGHPSSAVATGGKFRYEEREVPDTFNMLIDYPQKVTIAVMGTQGNDFSGTGGRGAGGRSPIIRGWEGALTFLGKQIVFTPADGSKKTARQFPIEHGEDMALYWENFLDCCRKRRQQTLSSAELAYHVQTALIMGFLALRHEKVAKFDRTREQIII